jgi:penicillin-binding protein 2
MRDEGKKLTVYSRRSLILGAINALMFTSLYSRLVQLQIFQSGRYKIMSARNSMRISMTPPERGIIYDGHNVELAVNENYTRLVIDDRRVPVIMDTIKQLNEMVLSRPLLLDENHIKVLLRRSSPSSPLTLITDLDWDELSQLEFYRYKFEKIRIESLKRRYYPYGALFAHALGYVANPTEEQLKKSNVGNYQDLAIGKNGVEKLFEDKLKGTPGFREIEVDAKGKIVRNLSNVASIKGQDLKISLRYDLQKEVAAQFANKKGACVVMDAQNGQILAMYSSPSFDPNKFISGITQQYWHELINDSTKPLINKCISGAFPPGSTFKPITAIAALISGIDPEETVFCNGEFKVGSRIFHCVKRSGHGDVNMRVAIAKSCNVYCYKVAQDIGIDAIANTARLFGLGSVSGLNLPYEVAGLIPDPVWKRQRFKSSWMLGDTANAAIGQGYVLATPISLANMIARIASGLRLVPSLELADRKFDRLEVDPRYLEVVRQGMYMALNDSHGSNHHNRHDGAEFKLSGKTGTAQIASLIHSKGHKHLDEHGLFVGFAPFNNPKYAISVVVEHGVWGSVSALPVAKRVMNYLKDNTVP